VSSGMKTAPIFADSAADPLGWRVANALAVVAPYLLAAALFAVLYLQPASPPAQVAQPTPPAPASQLPTTATPAPNSTPTPLPAAALTPAAAPRSAIPAHAKNTAPPVSGAAAPVPAKEEPLPTQPVPVDAAIAGTMKLSGDAVTYPSAARGTHIQGEVVVSAIIGPDGAVRSVQPVSGPALLELATMNAVRTWHYRPYLFYGKPVAFQTQVIIDFKVDESPQ
jgi:periplasmic protein TonB